MYKLEHIEGYYENYSDINRLCDRIDNLIIAKKKGLKSVLYVTENIFTQSIRYRVDHYLSVINSIDGWYGLKIEVNCEKIIKKYINLFDVIVFHRTYYSNVKEVIELARENSVPIYFDIDDYIFHDSCITSAVKATSRSMNERTKMAGEYYDCGMACDGIITSTRYLKEKIEEILNKQAIQAYNFLNYNETTVADKYYEKKLQKNHDDIFCMGYFSGSTGHNNDFKLISDQIERLMTKYEKMQLRIVGYLEIPENLRKFEEIGRIEKKPLMNGCDLIRECAEIDLNLVPLKLNDFTHARSEIKYFDSAIVGTLTLASPAMVYSDLNRNYECEICEDNEWYDTIEAIFLEDKEKKKKRMVTLHNESSLLYSFSKQKDRVSEMLDRMIHEEEQKK